MNYTLSDDKLTYSETFEVFASDTDSNFTLTPAALLRYCQHCVLNHSMELGLSLEKFTHAGVSFMIGRVSFEWERIPQAGEIITMRTQSEGMNHGFFKRIYEIFDADGNRLGIADGRNMLVTTATRKILRTLPDVFEDIPCTPHIKEEVVIHVPRVESTDFVREVTATYSLCDFNGHMNNTSYANIICDALPVELIVESPVKRMTINYRREINRGASVDVSRTQLPDGSWYVAGTHDGVKHFDSVVELF